MIWNWLMVEQLKMWVFSIQFYLSKKSWWNRINSLTTFSKFLSLFSHLYIFIVKFALISCKHLMHTVFIFMEAILICLHWSQLVPFCFLLLYFYLILWLKKWFSLLLGHLYLKSQMYTYMHNHMHIQMYACTYNKNLIQDMY